MPKVSVKETASRLVLVGVPDHLKKLSVAYRIQPPDYWRSPRYQLYKQTEGERGWDGYLYPLKKVSETTYTLERGHLDDLKDKADRLGIELDLSNVLVSPFNGMTLDDVTDDLVESEYPPYPHQREAVLKWLVRGIGINEITVSGGKTRTFCMAASLIKRRIPKARVLYLVPTERLARQGTIDATGFLPGFHITQYGGGKKDNTGEDLVVATYAMVHKNFKALDKQGWFKTFTAVLVDECHHASSPSLSQIITSTICFFKLGATDSAKEDDPIRGFKIRGLLGSVLSEVKAGPMIQEGKLAKPLIYLIDDKTWHNELKDLTHQPSEGSTAWAYMGEDWKKGIYLGPAVKRDENDLIVADKHGNPFQLPNLHRLLINDYELDVESRWCLLDRLYDRGIIRFKKRNHLITQWAKYFSGQKERTLVICTRTLHILILQMAIEKVVDESLVRILFSEHTSKQRDETFDWFRETPGAVLITPLVKEGVSINEITSGIMADYVGSVDVARQMIGRFIRKKLHRAENHAKIVWFIDRQCPTYRRGSLNLFSELERIRGYEFYHPVLEPGSEELALKYEVSLSREAV